MRLRSPLGSEMDNKSVNGNYELLEDSAENRSLVLSLAVPFIFIIDQNGGIVCSFQFRKHHEFHFLMHILYTLMQVSFAKLLWRKVSFKKSICFPNLMSIKGRSWPCTQAWLKVYRSFCIMLFLRQSEYIDNNRKLLRFILWMLYDKR